MTASAIRPRKKTSLLRGVPEGAKWITLKGSGQDCKILQLTGDVLKKGPISGLMPQDFGRFLSFERRKQWWCRPRFGASLADLEPLAFPGRDSSQIQMLLWECADGGYALLLPLVHGDVRAYLTGPPANGRGLSLVTHGGGQTRADVLLAARGPEPFALIHGAIAAASEHLRTFRLRETKTYPPIYEGLGWCSWEAMGFDVTDRKILAALRSVREAGIPLSWVLIDDGWMQINADSALTGFEAERTRFPGGIGRLVKKIQQKFGVRSVGLWLAFQGYWNGVALRGPWDDLPLLKTGEKRKNLKGREVAVSRFVAPENAAQFFHRWFGFLRQQGIAMVKVDGQSNMDRFTEGVVPHGAAMRNYEQAVQGAAAAHFEGGLMACMCHSSDALFAFDSTAVIRSSPDHSHKPQHVHFHQPHIINNVFNSLFVGALGWTDWDMFTTTETAAEFHAVGRAISGGPVYLGDGAGRHDVELVAKLITADGQVLRCPSPARPTRDCLFTDCLREARLLKASNRNGSFGVLGLFHCRWSEESAERIAIEDRFCPDDVPEMEGEQFAVYLHFTDRLLVLKKREKCVVKLDFMKAEVATISPLVQCGGTRVAAFGLLDKFNGSAAVTTWVTGDGFAVCGLRDGGRAGFFAQHRPKSVLANGRKVKWNYSPQTQRLTVHCPAGQAHEIAIRF